MQGVYDSTSKNQYLYIYIYIIIYVMNDYIFVCHMQDIKLYRGFGFGDLENFDIAENCDVATLAVAMRF